MCAACWTNGQVIDQLNSGTRWTGDTITYSFPTLAEAIFTGNGEGDGFSALTAKQQMMAEIALKNWDDLIAPSFQKIAAGASWSASNIEFGNSTTGVSYAHAYYAGVSSVWFNKSYDMGNADLLRPEIGRQGFTTFAHEIGHAIGLNHMGDYNMGDNNGPSCYQDSTMYSIMSYFGPSRGLGESVGEGVVAWADWIGSDGGLYGPSTPMMNDILAIQEIYGADTTTRVEDTTYGFQSTLKGSSKAIYDFTMNEHPILCIYDAGGNDTINLSGWATDNVINLAPGSFSSGNDMTCNISIAYNCNIENAVGGIGSDQILGNALDNMLIGRAGDDNLSGLDGNDRLIGARGNDTLFGGNGADILTGGRECDMFVFGGTIATEHADVITDFNVQADTIGFKLDAFATFGAAGELDTTRLVIGTQALDADDAIIYNSQTGGLYFDGDGVGGQDAILLATLATKLDLTAADFLIL